MKIGEKINILLLVSCSILSSGILILLHFKKPNLFPDMRSPKCFVTDASPYDYSFTAECLRNPLPPQYEGGIVKNPKFNNGLKGWQIFGTAKLEHRVSKEGNNFIVARDRKERHACFSQQFEFDKNKYYTFSAWLQVSKGTSEIAAMYKGPSYTLNVGWVTAKSGCWSLLKGGIAINISGPGTIYFQFNDTDAELWGDNISLQSFTEEEWRSHQDQSIKQARKSKVKMYLLDGQGNPLVNTKVSITQSKRDFPLGCAINTHILTNKNYQDWFLSRFAITTFEDELKWYRTEYTPGRENYRVADAMFNFAKTHNIDVRGHTVFWENPLFNADWVVALKPKEFKRAAERRINSLLGRYSGQAIHWDIVNENVHFSLLEDNLGKNASVVFYNMAHQLDSKALLFVNEFNAVEDPKDGEISPNKYLEKINEMRSMGYHGPLGIGVQGHFIGPHIAYLRATFDRLASSKLPIWVTELDVRDVPDEAAFLEQVLRETYSHPGVNGIILWSGWKPDGCYHTCLTDNKFKNLPEGDVVDKLIKEWSSNGLTAITDADGHFEISLFHGDFNATITHPSASNSSFTRHFSVRPQANQTLRLNFIFN